MKYQNKRNGQVATLVSRNEKFKTVALQLDESGKVSEVSESTLKRWWKLIEQDDEDKAGDGTPLTEVGKEIVSQAKQKAKDAKKEKAVEAIKKAVKEQKSRATDKPKKEAKEKAPKNKTPKAPKEKTPDVRQKVFDDIMNRIKKASGTECRTCAVPFFVAVKRNGKAFMEVRVNKKGYSINLKEEVAKAHKLKYVKYNNYYLPAGVKNLEYDKLNVLDSILKEGK